MRFHDREREIEAQMMFGRIFDRDIAPEADSEYQSRSPIAEAGSIPEADSQLQKPVHTRSRLPIAETGSCHQTIPNCRAGSEHAVP
jgi:hypothetical protein